MLTARNLASENVVKLERPSSTKDHSIAIVIVRCTTGLIALAMAGCVALFLI